MDEKYFDENPEEQPQELALVEANVQMEPVEEEQSQFALVRVRRRRRVRNKNSYSKLLLERAKKAVKIIKCLVIAAGVLAAILLVYGILALTVMNNKEGALIGFFVILSLVLAIFIALIVMFVYAKIQLDKLKRLR